MKCFFASDHRMHCLVSIDSGVTYPIDGPDLLGEDRACYWQRTKHAISHKSTLSQSVKTFDVLVVLPKSLRSAMSDA